MGKLKFKLRVCEYFSPKGLVYRSVCGTTDEDKKDIRYALIVNLSGLENLYVVKKDGKKVMYSPCDIREPNEPDTYRKEELAEKHTSFPFDKIVAYYTKGRWKEFDVTGTYFYEDTWYEHGMYCYWATFDLVEEHIGLRSEGTTRYRKAYESVKDLKTYVLYKMEHEQSHLSCVLTEEDKKAFDIFLTHLTNLEIKYQKEMKTRLNDDRGTDGRTA